VRERERDRETDAVPPIIGPTGNRNPYSVCIIRNVYAPNEKETHLCRLLSVHSLVLCIFVFNISSLSVVSSVF